MIYMYFDPEGGAPGFEVPTFPELKSPRWRRPLQRRVEDPGFDIHRFVFHNFHTKLPLILNVNIL